MVKKFGLTWWGQKWVEAIERMDYKRLVRGKRYAGNGSVQSIEINKNKVTAKVKGSRSRPYSVTLELKKLPVEDQKIIVEQITENPVIFGKFLRGEFPHELEEILQFVDIDIFPRDWNELKPHCSCPDWAVPCKHLAAVMYLIGAEIDKNPFTLFTIRGFDILAEIEKNGIKIDKRNRSNIKNISEYLLKKKNIKKDIIENQEESIIKESVKKSNKKSEEELKIENKINKIDFSIIKEIRQNILKLLNDNPDFFMGKNFKDIFNKFYIEMKKTASYIEMLDLESKEKEDDKKNYKLNDFLIMQNPKNGKYSYNIFQEKKETEVLNINEIIEEAINIPLDILVENSPKHAELILIRDYTLTLIKNGAFVPELLRINEEDFIIQWKPSLIDKNVKTCFENLIKIISDDTFVVKAGKEDKQTEKRGRITYNLINKDSIVLGLISIFINDVIEKNLIQTRIRDIYDNSNTNYHKIIDLFFYSKLFSPNKFGEETIVQSINIWLSKFHLTSLEMLPIIQAEEIKTENDKIKEKEIKEKEIKEKQIKEKQIENILIDIIFEIRNGELIENISLDKIFTLKKFEKYRVDIIKSIGMIADYFPELNYILETKGQEKIIKTLHEFSDILFNILPLIKLMGLKVMLPKGMQDIINPQISLSAKSKSQTTKTYLDFNKMIEFDYTIAIGDSFIDKKEFLKLVKNKRGLMKIKENYFYIDESFINKLNNLDENPTIKGKDRIKALVTEKYEDVNISISSELREMINEFINGKEVEKPKNLNAILRDYQIRGYEWLYKNARTGFGSLIADDMGLGKTLQVIALVTKLKEENKLVKNKALITVPTTLLTNWKKEFEKFSPEIDVFIYHGVTRKKQIEEVQNYDVMLTSYGIIRSDIEVLSKEKWEVIAIDEAQNIKNPETNQSKAIKKIKANIKIAMTGTPVENRLTEYWSIFDFINKGYLGNLKKFKTEFALPIENDRNKETLSDFRKITSPFIIRRLKNDKTIIKDLPDKIENDRFCNLTKGQAALYKSVVDNLMTKIETSDGIDRKGIIFKLMTSLKQICNHPGSYLKNDVTSKDESGKLQSLMELLENIHENNEKVLIFTQYKEMGDILVEEIGRIYDKPLFLHGGISRKKRDEMVEKFQNDPQEKIFILSLKAGGTGLNLTKASNVIHYDLWWNPAVESQATDRAYRIGQVKNVNVYRLITQGTFEEKINEMIQEKKELADLAVSKGESWIGNMSNQEIKDIFKI